jgi:hypothetical protein
MQYTLENEVSSGNRRDPVFRRLLIRLDIGAISRDFSSPLQFSH